MFTVAKGEVAFREGLGWRVLGSRGLGFRGLGAWGQLVYVHED